MKKKRPHYLCGLFYIYEHLYIIVRVHQDSRCSCFSLQL